MLFLNFHAGIEPPAVNSTPESVMGEMTDDAAAWHLRRLDDDPYQPPALIALHATLMTCAFMVMMPLGVQ